MADGSVLQKKEVKENKYNVTTTTVKSEIFAGAGETRGWSREYYLVFGSI
jgi:hypothetical protein